MRVNLFTCTVGPPKKGQGKVRFQRLTHFTTILVLMRIQYLHLILESNQEEMIGRSSLII